MEGGPSGEELRSFRALLEREHHEFAVELGAPASVAINYEGPAARFVLGPRAANPMLAALDPPRVDRPTLSLYRGERLLVADASDLAGVEECLSLLRTLTSSNADRVEATDCVDVDDVVDRVVREVAVTYPAFASGDWTGRRSAPGT